MDDQKQLPQQCVTPPRGTLGAAACVPCAENFDLLWGRLHTLRLPKTSRHVRCLMLCEPGPAKS